MRADLEETDLRIRFRELREGVAASTPPFVVTRVPTTKRPPLSWMVATMGAVALVAVLLWTTVFRGGRTSVSGIDLSVIVWTAPTDFLLETPGRQLLRTVPVIDVDVYAPVSREIGRGVVDSSS